MEDRYDGTPERDLLRMFSREIAKFKVLTREEEAGLLSRIREGEPGALNRLIEANIRFALKAVFRYWIPGFPLMDMVSEACLGLVVAAKTFNPAAGFRFTTYAEQSIRQRVIAAMCSSRRPLEESLDRPAYHNGDGLYGDSPTMKDLLVSEDDNPEERAQQTDIKSYLALLNKRERKVIILRFWHDASFGYIGSMLNVAGKRAAEINARALIKLRFAMKGMEVPWRNETRQK
jgi:RNA polymerase primary sigma factor